MKQLIQIIATILVLFLTGCGQELQTGRPGRDGKDGQQGQIGNTGASGAKGDKGDIGSTGLTGAQGPQGTPGTNGTDASIALIQLCGSCHAVYPSVFPEVGLCIDHKLYGVYSANGGFMVEITPGAYSSNGINCSCNFTITANCEVN